MSPDAKMDLTLPSLQPISGARGVCNLFLFFRSCGFGIDRTTRTTTRLLRVPVLMVRPVFPPLCHNLSLFFRLPPPVFEIAVVCDEAVSAFLLQHSFDLRAKDFLTLKRSL